MDDPKTKPNLEQDEGLFKEPEIKENFKMKSEPVDFENPSISSAISISGTSKIISVFLSPALETLNIFVDSEPNEKLKERIKKNRLFIKKFMKKIPFCCVIIIF